MFGAVKKVPTKCPHCGFVQHEPTGLISTYCRGCGDHYTVGRRELELTKPVPKLTPTLRNRVREKLLAQPPRRVICHECQHEHNVRAHARNTACPACGTEIILHDIQILGHNTSVVQTRGTVHVGRDGFLNSTRVVCGNAFVEGRIAGKVTCAETLRLRGSGLCRAQITARRLIIDRGTTLRFSSTLHVQEIIIRGHVEADVQCAGTLHIGRHGALKGDVLARSMIVDKGGHYTGKVQVSSGILRSDPEPRQDYRIRVLPGWQTRLAFG